MSTSAVAAGASVSHYRLLESIGRGGMGEVWLAEDTQLPRKVAVKLLAPHLAADPEAVERLLREAKAAASVDHPGVVTVYDAGVEAGRPYLVMQHVEGETLERRLERGPLPVAEAVSMLRALADALAEVHALGIVHRDLKPANVMLTARGPRILDFGVVAVKGATSLTAAGVALGTPLAMSPEQFRGLPPDNRSDLWSLGVIFYQALTGRPPFAGSQYEAVMYAVLNDVPPPPRSLRPEIGADLEFIVLKLLRRDPAHRYARAEDLIADLESAAAAASEPAPAPGRETPRLAVLSFDVMSNEPDDAFLAAGLVEDLIVDLTRVKELRVASRAEAMAVRGRTLPPRTLARELNATHLLQGSVRRAGARTRISVQLVRGSDGHVLWADRFDRTTGDLFDMQAEVSQRIVQALEVQLRPGEREMLGRAPTRSPEAYTLYLRGRELLDLRVRDANFRAETLLLEAIELDPSFALALAALGEVYARRGYYWWAELEIADTAQRFAERALALEPDLLEGHMAMWMVHRLRAEPEKVLQSLERVLALDPEHEEGMELACWTYLLLGRPEQAIEIGERGIRLHPSSYRIASWLTSGYEMLGRRVEVEATNQMMYERLLDVLRRHPDDVSARSSFATALVQRGDREAGVRQAERVMEMAPDDGRMLYNAACALARAGETERALEALRRGVRLIPTYTFDWPQRDPDMANLHENPEFIRLFGHRDGRKPAAPESDPGRARAGG